MVMKGMVGPRLAAGGAVLWLAAALAVAQPARADVDLKAGEHKLEIEGMTDAVGFAFDCWVLAHGAFAPAAAPADTTK